MSKSTPTTTKNVGTAANKKDDKKDDKKDTKAEKGDLGFLEEDDEFEEFPAEDWADTEAEPEVGSVWEDNWDDDIEEEDFTKQLRCEYNKKGVKMTIPDVTPRSAAKV